MNLTKHKYRASFILDNRGREDTVEQLIDEVKKEIAAVEGEVSAVENLGKRDFVRVTDPKLTGATYVQIDFSAPAQAPAQLKERLRLNSTVYRAFVQTI